MDKEDIKINKAIVHILDSTIPLPVLSDVVLEHGSEFHDFLRSHIYKVLFSDDSKNCRFNTEESDVYKCIKLYNDENFITTSKNLAGMLFTIMNANIDILPADLLVVSYSVEGEESLALLKMNYKTSYTHMTQQHVKGNNNDIILQKALLPSEGQKLSEAVIIHLKDESIRILEKKYEINGQKVNYLSTLFLKCQTKLSQKTKLNIVTKALEDINKKYYEDQFDKQMEIKSVINQELLEQGAIHIEAVTDKIFKERVELKEEFKEKLEKYNIMEEEVVPQNKQTTKKFTKQHLTTDTGIEIKIPMEQYDNTDNVEFITNTDGSISILIKNIGSITSK